VDDSKHVPLYRRAGGVKYCNSGLLLRRAMGRWELTAVESSADHSGDGSVFGQVSSWHQLAATAGRDL
jgi:hypothetical protein